jgi:hypothetical protein
MVERQKRDGAAVSRFRFLFDVDVLVLGWWEEWERITW